MQKQGPLLSVSDFFLHPPPKMIILLISVLTNGDSVVYAANRSSGRLNDHFLSSRLDGTFYTTSFADVEGEVMKLRCPTGGTPTIQSSYFGFDKVQRTSDCVQKDRSSDLTQEMRETCGNGHCLVPSQNSKAMFGSPLYWQICFQCKLATTTTTTTARPSVIGDLGTQLVNRYVDPVAARDMVRRHIESHIESIANATLSEPFKAIEEALGLLAKYTLSDDSESNDTLLLLEVENLLTARLIRPSENDCGFFESRDITIKVGKSSGYSTSPPSSALNVWYKQLEPFEKSLLSANNLIR